ncbi:unnamed protein product [Paramecium sonneborni]|uniref:Uncharacterized protein n=1 Tax=Paramecium sonneborni TaxID=65129 RepID=A0A8S1RUS0_9CILI|nr:unnamed protein product [Paramecium sonneborni]
MILTRPNPPLKIFIIKFLFIGQSLTRDKEGTKKTTITLKFCKDLKLEYELDISLNQTKINMHMIPNQNLKKGGTKIQTKELSEEEFRYLLEILNEIYKYLKYKLNYFCKYDLLKANIFHQDSLLFIFIFYQFKYVRSSK